MRSSLRSNAVASRFQPFVEQLHSVFAECSVAHGSADDLPGFSEELSAKGRLRSGVRSSVRDLLRRLGEPVSHGDLVELILVAAGGAELDEETPAVQKAERVLSQLVGEAMTAPVAISYTRVNVAELPDDEPAPHQDRVSEPDTEGIEKAAALTTRSQIEHSDSPPLSVWAALVCGVLLAPCMYLWSRPHEVPSPASPIRSVSRIPPVVQAGPPAGLDSRVFNQLMSEIPGDLGAPASKKRPVVHLHTPDSGDLSRSNAVQSPLAARGTPEVAPLPDKSTRNSDSPRPDHVYPSPGPTPAPNPPQDDLLEG